MLMIAWFPAQKCAQDWQSEGWMWEVHYSHEAGIYLEDNGQLIAALFFAMEALATVGLATAALPPV